MAEQKIDNGHSLLLDNRNFGTITGVTDVVSFDEKQILLKTKEGTMTIAGSSLTLTRLDLEHGETDIHGRVDSILYSKEKKKAPDSARTVVRRWW